MDILQSLSIDNRLAALQAETTPAHGELGRQAFLDLLVSQLENQDPLSPLQDHEFVAQLATFSSLEQLESINDGMQASLLMNQSVNNSLATNLIGKDVLAVGGEVTLGESGEPRFQLELAAAADVSVLIRDAQGKVVRALERGHLPAGPNTIEWDGRTDAGDRAAPGPYVVEVLALDDAGLSVQSTMRVSARVEGVRFVDGIGYLMVGGTNVPLSSVMEVLASSG